MNREQRRRLAREQQNRVHAFSTIQQGIPNMQSLMIDYQRSQEDMNNYQTAQKLIETHGLDYARKWLDERRKEMWGPIYRSDLS